MACLDTIRTAAFVAGALPAAERHVAEGHLAACAGCRRLVSEVARDPSCLGRSTEVGFATASMDPRRSPRPGDRVGRFLIRGVLGTGGMGVVYDAYDEQLQRPVALKQLRPRPPGDEASLHTDQTWISEARALARLHHPNVVTLYEVVPQAGAHFLALERVDGVTLRSWMRARPRTAEQILEVFLAAAHGLEAAHAAGIVHRDFKPDNVLVGRDGRVRVADFGLAMPISVCEPVAAAGTPRYVAPEQARGEPPDARCDQYSFAVALLEGLSGATTAAALTSRNEVIPLAGRGKTLFGRLAARKDRVFPSCLHFNCPSRPFINGLLGLADLPGPLWTVISRALAVTPAQRYPDMTALIGALQRARRRRQAQRRLGMMAAIASLLIAATANGAWRAHQEALRSRERLELAREAEAAKAREAALLRQRHASMAEEAAALRSSQTESAREAAALRAQIASLVGDLEAAAMIGVQARVLRRTLQQRETQVRALTLALARAEQRPSAIRNARPAWSDQSPHPLVVERHVRRLSRPLQSCLTDPEGRLRLPPDPGASLLITASGTTARADVTGVEDVTRRACVARVLAGLRIPPFDSPAVRAYAISLSWLGLDARIRVLD